MELTVVNKEGQLLVDSRQVAEMVGKEHKNLLADIRGYVLYMENLGELKVQPSSFFVESSYISEQNRVMPCYLLTRKGCDTVAHKMTGEKGFLFTATYVTKFEEMEKQLTFSLPKTFAEALQLAADQARQLEAAKPAVEFVGRYVETSTTKSIREVAKIVGIPERAFIALMINEKILYRLNNVLVPYANHQHGGHFDVKTGVVNNRAYHQTRFTTDGVVWISQLAERSRWID